MDASIGVSAKNLYLKHTRSHVVRDWLQITDDQFNDLEYLIN